MKRRNFFKRLGCLIAGFAIAPIMIKATKNEINEGWVYRGGWNCHNQYVPMYVIDLPGIINGQAESKEMFELRKSIFRPMTDKLVKKIMKSCQ